MPEVAPVTDPERRAATSGADPTSYMSHDDAEKFATNRAENNIKQGKRGVVAVNSNSPGVQKLSGAEKDANKKVESDLDYLDELLGRKREGVSGALVGAITGAIMAGGIGTNILNSRHPDAGKNLAKVASTGAIAGSILGHFSQVQQEKIDAENKIFINNPKNQEKSFNEAVRMFGEENSHHPIPYSAISKWKKDITEGRVKGLGYNHFVECMNNWINTKEGYEWNTKQTKKLNEIIERSQIWESQVVGGHESIQGGIARKKFIWDPADDLIGSENPYTEKINSRNRTDSWMNIAGPLIILLGAAACKKIYDYLKAKLGKEPTRDQIEKEAKSMKMQESRDPYIDELLGRKLETMSDASKVGVGASIATGAIGGAARGGVAGAVESFEHDPYIESLLAEGVAGAVLDVAEHAAPAVASGAGTMIKKAAKWVAGNAAAGIVTGKVADMTMAHSKAQREDSDEPKKTKMSESTKGLLTAHVIPAQQFGSHCISSQLQDLPPAVENDPISAMWRQQDMLRLRGRNHVA